MKKHYFIDYENVREHGLNGLSGLNGDSYVHLMFTSNANKISLDSLINFNGAHVEIMKTPAGKQSLDMQLVSYLGFLIGRESDEENEYIIVSKDKGYKNTELFWNSNSSLKGRVIIQPKISVPEQEEKPAAEQRSETAEQVRAADAAEQETSEPVVASEAKVSESAETENSSERKPQTAKRTRHGRRASTAKQKAEEPVLQPSEESMPAEKQDTQPSAPDPQESKEHSPEESSKRELNSKLMKALSETGMDNKMVGQIASLCVKLSGRENHRQAVYRGIISKLGQKKGLEIYHIIKGII